MNDHPVHREDIAALRQEGDLRTYLSGLRAQGRARLTETKPKPRKRAVLKPPGHRPGQWPPGTSSPGPPAEWSYPKEVWDAAVRHYRNETHRPNQPCDCGNCPPKEEA